MVKHFELSPTLVVESVDTQDLKSCDRKVVRVQVPPGVQMDEKPSLKKLGFFNVSTFLKLASRNKE